MHSASCVLCSMFLYLPVGVAGAQSAATSSVQVAPTSPAVAAPASSLLQPSLQNLARTVGTIEPDKWKLQRSLHEETRRNLDSIRRDIDDTLPALMSAADAVPASVTAEFALLRNVDALYDVALRIAATGEIAGPASQSAAVEQSLTDLLQARRALGDRIAADAVTQQGRVAELQASLRSAAAVPAPVCPAASPAAISEKGKAKRTRPRPKPAPAAATAPSNP